MYMQAIIIEFNNCICVCVYICDNNNYKKEVANSISGSRWHMKGVAGARVAHRIQCNHKWNSQKRKIKNTTGFIYKY